METFLTCKEQKILVSPEYDTLKQYKANINKHGYVSILIKNKLWLLHRYIMTDVLKDNIKKGYVVDHINNDRLDNRKENLRVITRSNNSRNKKKRQTSTSKYYGVFLDKKTNKWKAAIVYNNAQLVAPYDNEIHAAYQYDMWVKGFGLTTAKCNNIATPTDFVQYKASILNKSYPKGINKHGNKFRVTISINGTRKHIDSVIKLEDAIRIIEESTITKQRNTSVIQELKMKFNVKKNADGNYIFMIRNKAIIIDKSTYPFLYKHIYYVTPQNYVKTGKNLLSRLLMNCSSADTNLVVDHINGNTLDNRRCNLRLITQAQNALNQSSSKNSLSKYLGVYWNKLSKKWTAMIKVDGKNKYLGIFERESDAALARDYATKQYYKEYGRLNFPERPGWDEYMMTIAEAVKLRSPDFYKVGGVLVSIKSNRIISTGYNSIASNLDDNIDWSKRDFINDTVIHAEMNVLLYSESKFEDSILYITTSPCVSCLKMLSASKIKKIIYKHKYKDIEKVQKLARFMNIELIEYENVR